MSWCWSADLERYAVAASPELIAPVPTTALADIWCPKVINPSGLEFRICRRHPARHGMRVGTLSRSAMGSTYRITPLAAAARAISSTFIMVVFLCLDASRD